MITIISNLIDKYDLKNSFKILITNVIYRQKVIIQFNWIW